MTNIYTYTNSTIIKAAETIKNGGLVAFPTETVYGLGANSYNAKAVAKIFEAKGRPNFNPLISHIAEVENLFDLAKTDERVIALAKQFWPGPLTFVLNRKKMDPSFDLVCAGLPTLSVRMPNHPIALELIKQAGVPIAAPSANRSQSISPTTARHVYESLGNRVDMILDGGACNVGVESTIIDLTTTKTVMLRAGGLAKEDLEKFLNEEVLLSHGNPDLPSSPGQMLKHYAPRIPTRINVTANDRRENEFYIGFGNMDCNLNLSIKGDLVEAAANLFAFMHLAEEQTKYPAIAIAPIPNKNLGLAINDRIKRASYNK
jgi:L-threonylcarbamoyladenylate synthase